MLPKPGSKEWDKMVDLMRYDLDNNMCLSRMVHHVKKSLTEQGRDFNDEFEQWKKERKK